jgi:hypothetical protein
VHTAACAIVRDEERDLAEWIAFQFAVGFDAVLAYDNHSIDRTPDIARAFGWRFDVRLIDWPTQTAARSRRPTSTPSPAPGTSSIGSPSSI